MEVDGYKFGMVWGRDLVVVPANLFGSAVTVAAAVGASVVVAGAAVVGRKSPAMVVNAILQLN